MTRLLLRSLVRWAAVALVAAAAFGGSAAAQGAAPSSAQQGGAGYRSHIDLPPAPSPPRLVNDFAGIFSAAERDALERKLVAVDDSTGAQIAVVVVPSLDGYDEVEYATEVLRAWGVGRAGVDNGVVLLVAPNERRVAIATGYGAEGALTDATSGTIIRTAIVPAFREGQYYAGVDRATDDIIAALAGEFSAPAAPGGSSDGLASLLCCLFLLFVVMLVIVSRRHGGAGGPPPRRRRGGGWGGPGVIVLPGGWGGGLGGGGFGGGGGFSGGGGFGGFGGGFGGGGGAGGGW